LKLKIKRSHQEQGLSELFALKPVVKGQVLLFHVFLLGIAY
jgi:hypothetical protein